MSIWHLSTTSISSLAHRKGAHPTPQTKLCLNRLGQLCHTHLAQLKGIGWVDVAIGQRLRGSRSKPEWRTVKLLYRKGISTTETTTHHYFMMMLRFATRNRIPIQIPPITIHHLQFPLFFALLLLGVSKLSWEIQGMYSCSCTDFTIFGGFLK